MIGMRLLKRTVLCVIMAGVLAGLVGAVPAYASSVWFGLTSGSHPTNLSPGGTGEIVVTAENRGYAPADGGSIPIVIKDELPAGLEETGIEGAAGAEPANGGLVRAVQCSWGVGQEGECRLERGTHDPAGEAGVLPPYQQIEVRIRVKVAASASSSEQNTVSVSGGGASGVKTITRPLGVGASSSFGVEAYEVLPEEVGGVPSTQAGVHPFQLSTVLDLNTSLLSPEPLEQEPAAMTKDLSFRLPPGLIGNPTPFAQCTDEQFNAITKLVAEGFDECGPQTAIGVATVTYNLPGAGGLETLAVPLFNLVPLPGEPARFGFDVGTVTTTLNFAVRTGGDYGVTVNVNNINEAVGFLSSKIVVWGVPGAAIHDGSRGWGCLNSLGACSPLGAVEPPPLLSLPTACTGAMRTTVQADSWVKPHPADPTQAPLFSEYLIGGLDGCNRLQFNPEVSVAPDVPDASTSTGLTVDLHVPQTAALNPEGLAEGTLRDTTVTLPVGIAVNSSGADGLEACSEGLVGYLQGESNPPEELHFTAKKPGSFGAEGSEKTLEPGTNFCPDGSKIGTVKITTPLLPNPVQGAIYLADQNSNPFGSLIAMYAVAEDPVSGTLIKLPFNVTLNPSTDQLVASSDNSPELPFETAEFHFFGGETAPLATPAHCGPYETKAAFEPWSARAGEAPRIASSTFQIERGPKTLAEPNGSPCPGAQLPFSPSLTGGATNINAGAFSPFTLTMTRKDGEQNLQSVEAHLPPGLLGQLSSVELCPEPQADDGACGPNSLIGEATVAVGVGGHPFTVSGGKFYITGPYNGSGGCTVGTPGCAPFGLTFEVPAKAGPFDLERNSQNPAGEDACDCLVVRGQIEVNPLTAALTITSDPPGSPYAIPTSIEGIPLEIQHVNATTTRSDFQFNPTSCEKMEVTGTIHSAEGGTNTLGVPFQVTNCADLKFEPAVAVSTQAKTSKADGASLAFKFTKPDTQGVQADLAKLRIELPKQLPSRLTTLQKACTAAQFNANPAGCPAPSVVGHMRVLTPLLPVPAEGPMYFVSNGGEAFPNLVVVLQGDGVTVRLVGTTFISKSGVTSTTFKTLPDVPFSSAEVTLPEGPYSALAANGNLCALTKTVTVKQKVTVKVHGHRKTVTRKITQTRPTTLQMPAEFVAQSGGAPLDKTIPITVTGCPRTKRAKQHKVKHHGGGKGGSRNDKKK